MGCAQSSISRETLFKKSREDKIRPEDNKGLICSPTTNILYQTKNKISPLPNIKLNKPQTKNLQEEKKMKEKLQKKIMTLLLFCLKIQTFSKKEKSLNLGLLRYSKSRI